MLYQQIIQEVLPVLPPLISSVGFLVLVGTAIINVFLSVLVYRADPKSTTNKIFFWLGVFMTAWLLTYIVYLPQISLAPLLMTRLGIFFATPMSTLFFLLAHTMPAKKFNLKKRTLFYITLATFVVMALTLSPYAFENASIVSGNLEITPGWAFIPFALLSTVFSFFAIFVLFKKFKDSEGETRRQARTVLLSILLMLTLVILTIPLPIIFLRSGTFVSFIPIYSLIFLGMTAYAITKYRLFNIKVLVTQAITLVIWVTLFSKIFIAVSWTEQLVDTLIFLITVIFGISLIRSVKREIRQREQIQQLASNLQIANEGQENLLHVMNHQIKGYLGATKNAFAELLSGDYGTMPETAIPLIQGGLDEANRGVNYVLEILQGNSAATGTLPYIFKPLDLTIVVNDVINRQRPIAQVRGLTFESKIASGKYLITGDSVQLGEALRNLVENAIRYNSPKGRVIINLKREGEYAIFSVTDNGPGIADDVKDKLFTPGGNSKNSIKFNPESSGFGLAFVKGVIEKHGGTVGWKPNVGEAGTTFFVRMPVK